MVVSEVRPRRLRADSTSSMAYRGFPGAFVKGDQGVETRWSAARLAVAVVVVGIDWAAAPPAARAAAATKTSAWNRGRMGVTSALMLPVLERVSIPDEPPLLAPRSSVLARRASGGALARSGRSHRRVRRAQSASDDLGAAACRSGKDALQQQRPRVGWRPWRARSDRTPIKSPGSRKVTGALTWLPSAYAGTPEHAHVTML